MITSRNSVTVAGTLIKSDNANVASRTIVKDLTITKRHGIMKTEKKTEAHVLKNGAKATVVETDNPRFKRMVAYEKNGCKWRKRSWIR